MRSVPSISKEVLDTGVRKPDEVFNFEHSQNRLQTWLYRLLGWFLMFLGYNCVSSLLDIIGKFFLSRIFKNCINDLNV